MQASKVLLLLLALCSPSNAETADDARRTSCDMSTCEYPALAGDGKCDAATNVAACCFDNGDCCSSTCVDDSAFPCRLSDDECHDPLVNQQSAQEQPDDPAAFIADAFALDAPLKDDRHLSSAPGLSVLPGLHALFAEHKALDSIEVLDGGAAQAHPAQTITALRKALDSGAELSFPLDALSLQQLAGFDVRVSQQSGGDPYRAVARPAKKQVAAASTLPRRKLAACPTTEDECRDACNGAMGWMSSNGVGVCTCFSFTLDCDDSSSPSTPSDDSSSSSGAPGPGDFDPCEDYYIPTNDAVVYCAGGLDGRTVNVNGMDLEAGMCSDVCVQHSVEVLLPLTEMMDPFECLHVIAMVPDALTMLATFQDDVAACPQLAPAVEEDSTILDMDPADIEALVTDLLSPAGAMAAAPLALAAAAARM